MYDGGKVSHGASSSGLGQIWYGMHLLYLNHFFFLYFHVFNIRKRRKFITIISLDFDYWVDGDNSLSSVVGDVEVEE